MKTKFDEFIFESSKPNIHIEESDDEKSPYKKSYNVNYQLETGEGLLVEIEGTLTSYKTGRSEDYKFEPDYFTDGFSEEYWDEYWEDIEEEIINYFTFYYI